MERGERPTPMQMGKRRLVSRRNQIEMPSMLSPPEKKEVDPSHESPHPPEN